MQTVFFKFYSNFFFIDVEYVYNKNLKKNILY